MISKGHIAVLASMVLLAGLFPTIGSEGSDPEGIGPSRGDLSKDMNIKDVAFASYLGERPNSRSGASVAGLGDVNGDGIDDIIIGASDDNEWGMLSGQAYLLFGDPFALKKGVSLSEADASFYGNQEGMAGFSVAGAGDVNGDGLNDILIGSHNDPEGAIQAGKAYLVFGKRTGWETDTPLSGSSASFIGMMPHMQCGYSVAGAGDVNGDGYDDILIGSRMGRAYLFFGKASGWSQNRQLPSADVVFTEEAPVQGVGEVLAGAGDVNGDGYDDILIGAPLNGEGGNNAGQTYLILGRQAGWVPDVLLTNADGSFIGQAENDWSGFAVDGAGDVNGDGYDDILIGAPANDSVGPDSGQSYLVLGKRNGWSMDMPLSAANASFLGEVEYDSSGRIVSSAGDVDHDGLDDILLSSPYNGDNGYDSGKVHLICGRTSGWKMNMSLSDADASFMGESNGDNAGSSISWAGDPDKDGVNEIVVSSMHNSGSETLAGKTYIIKGPTGTEPLSVQSVELYSDGSYSQRSGRFDKGESVHIEMKGVDGNDTHADIVRVIVGFSRTYEGTVNVFLRETGISTGVYRGSFKVPAFAEYFETLTFHSAKDPTKSARMVVDYPYRPGSVTSIGVYPTPFGSTPVDKLDFGQTAYFRCVGTDANPSKADKAFVNLSSNKNASYSPLIILTETGASTGTYVAQFIVPATMQWFENITLTSVETPARTARFMVHTPVLLRASTQYTEALEDTEYRVSFYNFGYNSVVWTVSENAYWLNWNAVKNELYGTARNNDVSDTAWEVFMTIEDEFEHKSSLEYFLKVRNAPPTILTPPITQCFESQAYLVDFNCDDDGQGDMTWSLATLAPFLKIDRSTGVLSGNPIIGDAGTYYVSVSVHDGNGGVDELTYNLTVLNENDPPRITTTDIKQVEQDTPFRRDYDVYDPDVGDSHNWTLRTDADWLSMENGTGLLSGTPDGYDVGDWLVNITVTDQGGLSDSREFTLKVLDIEDAPRFIDVPGDSELPHGADYYFDVNATDADPGDRVTYSVVTDPSSDMVIDPTTGDLRWKATYRSMPRNDDGMKVTLTVSDGSLSSTHEFRLKVIPTQSPYCQLVSPVKGARTPEAGTVLEWGGTDPDGDPLLYILYLADTEAYVAARRPQDIVSDEITTTSYEMNGLAPGKVYYWTVIPDDTCTYGTCTNGIFNFRVNNRPRVEPVKDQFISEGDEFLYKVEGSDADADDLLTYTLSAGPSGMTVRSETGMVVWTPKAGQAGTHTVKLNVTDGHETEQVQFRVVVAEEEGINIGVVIGVAVALLVLLVSAVLIYIFVVRKGVEAPPEGPVPEEDDETRQLREQEESRKKALKEEGLEPLEGQVPPASVHSSAQEAHARDKTLEKKGYEELYGQPAPDKSEELTTEELKDELEKLAEQLKKAGSEDASIDLGEDESGS